MAENKKRQYLICLREGRTRLFFPTYRRLEDKAYSYPAEEILYLGYKDGDSLRKIKVLSVYSETLKEQIRTVPEALDELLAVSLKNLEKIL